VHLLFIVANHPEQQTDYLQVLSHLVTLLRDDQFRGELFGCMSPDELHTKLSTAFYRRARQQQLSSEEEAERSSAAVNG
jgi:mannitol/fructose-specific phosphotransferase system IIA component (Ntr-type)